jgi:thiamine-phosphate pyrophosphorylase
VSVNAPQLYLITPVIAEPAPHALPLREACAAGAIAAVLLRLAPADERTLVNRIKALAPGAQAGGAAVLVSLQAVPETLDLATISARGGADGVHAAGIGAVKALRERISHDRILGAGGLKTKHDAMTAGEIGVDYLLFGEPRPDGSLPPLEQVEERAEWWAEIFQTPCVAYAPRLEDVGRLAATRAEFLALGDAVWSHPGGAAAAVAAAQSAAVAEFGEP